GADPHARDAARLTRVPGSVNSKNNEPAQVLWPTNQRKPLTYSIEKLVDFFGLREPAKPAKRRPISRSGIKEELERQGIYLLAGNGWVGVNDQRLRQFLALWDMRAGFREGCRNHAALIYARLLSTIGVPSEAVSGLVKKLGKSCIPKLSDHEIAGAITS